MAKSDTRFLKVEEQHACGDKKALNPSQLLSLEKVCKNFRRLVEENCLNYALYRCNLTGEGGHIYAKFAGSDDKGNLHQVSIIYDMQNDEIYRDRVKFSNERKIADALYELVGAIDALTPSNTIVGMFDFPVEGKFKEGHIMGYNKEKGSALIIIKDSLDNDYYFADAY